MQHRSVSVIVFFFTRHKKTKNKKQIYIYPLDWLHSITAQLDFFCFFYKKGWGLVRIIQGQCWRSLTGTQEGTVKDRCSVFTSAWDRKSQLCCICAALPVTTLEIQPEI